MTQMVTTCPNCRQQLAVTPADLRVGQGYVRCGRCEKVFNALLTLAEDVPPAAALEAVAHGTGSVPAIEEMREADDELDLEALFDPDASPDGEVEVVETHPSARYHEIVMQGDQVVEHEEILDSEQVVRKVIDMTAGQTTIDILLPEEYLESSTPTAASAPPAARREEHFDADRAVGNPTRARWPSYLAAALLAMVLLGQVLHQNRQSLITIPALERPLQSVYGLLGRTVEPAWVLARYELPPLGGMELSGDSKTLVLRAAVAVNKEAPYAQPLPLIRVILSDNWGNVLARHEVPPPDWLLGEAPPRIAPGARVDAQLQLPAPERASSFALYACLPDATGKLHCADEQR